MDLRDQIWNEKFGDSRLTLWDDTNVNFNHNPTFAHTQRDVHSSHYGRDCAKGGGRVCNAADGSEFGTCGRAVQVIQSNCLSSTTV